MKLKIIFYILIVSCLCEVLPAQVSYPLSRINPVQYRDYPGGRGEDQLVQYTSEYGKSSTGTNQWGVEAIVRNNIIVYIGGNDSPIRDGEYVLSGHGQAKSFLLTYGRIGAKIDLRNETVFISFDAESFTYYSTLRQQELAAKMKKDAKYLSPIEKRTVQSIFDSLAQVKKIALQYSQYISDEKLYAAGTSLLNQADYLITETPLVESRGIWHRPIEKTQTEIDAFVQKFAEAGFNQIYVETVWRGETIYPGFITSQKKEFQGIDPLRLYINAGNKYGIEIHAWVHTFFVGYLGDTYDTSRGPIIEQHPDWSIVKRNGENISRAEAGYLFVNPALPDVQKYLRQLYQEIISMYPDLSGVQLDYIRYPVNVPIEESSDYSDYSRKTFKEFAGIDPLLINPTDHPAQWAIWKKWRADRVTEFVQAVREENTGAVLSADIFPDIEEALDTKMQDWGAWATRGLVDYLVPMAYTPNTDWIGDAILKMRRIVGDTYPLIIGLAPYLKLTPEILLRQIEKTREEKTQGIIFFASGSISDEQLQLLKSGPFRRPSKPFHVQRTQ